MEKIQEMKPTQEKNQEMKPPQEKNQEKLQKITNKLPSSLVWDCGSSLYDSFELKSFERQLDSALLQSRTLSMPHLVDRRVVAPPLPPPPQPPTSTKKSSSPSKISRSLNKFLKSVFKSTNKQRYSGAVLRVQDRPFDEYHVVYDKSGALTTIPEAPEIDFGGFSPEINSFVRRTASDRFAPATMGISCA